MGLPTEVEKQGKKAEEAQKELIEGGKTDLEKEVTAPTEDKAKPEKDAEKGKKADEEIVVSEDFKQKYEVLKGKYDTEIPQLREQLRLAQEAIEALKATKDSPKPKKEEGAEQPDKETKGPKQLDKENFSGYGEEMVEMVDSVNELIKENEALKGENAKLKGSVDAVGHSVAKTAQDRYYDTLEEAVPDIWTINKDPKWLEWLGQEDPLTGKTRQELLEEAQGNLDANRVARFFKTFSGGNGKDALSTDDIPKEEDNVVHDEGLAGDETGQPEKVVITPAQFTKATQDRIHGRITEEAYKKLSDDFQKQFQKGA
jgi:hypothetical protein